jgi:hypothetical protein
MVVFAGEGQVDGNDGILANSLKTRQNGSLEFLAPR